MSNPQEDVLKTVLTDFFSGLNEILEGLKDEPKQDEVLVPSTNGLTKRTMLELVSHEGIVLEAYKDSKGIWTWGIGVTNNSGHIVYPRYVDKPQPLSHVIKIFEWLVVEKYLPDVLEAFKGVDLKENELAAALSFHYNTGAILRASWVKSFKQGNISKAKAEFMNYRKPAEIIERRTKERDLFFNGVWSNKGKATVFEKVNKPSYTPKWSSAKAVDISEEF